MRKVQRTGVSSLAVTLPKAWTDSMGVQLGDGLRFRENGRGSLEVTLDRDEPRSSDDIQSVTIVATDAPASLITGLLVGAYDAGQDRITFTSRKVFTEAQRGAIHRTVAHTPGLSVVADLPDVLTLVVALDPTKRRLSGLVDHLTQLLQHELALCRRALAQRSPLLLAPVNSIDEDMQRTSHLLARQLLAAVQDPRVAQKIGAEGAHAQLGYRAVNNALESMSFQASAMARLLSDCMRSTCFSARACSDLGSSLGSVEELLALTMQAYNQVSASDAHLALAMIHSLHEDLTGLLVHQMEGKRCAILKQRVTATLLTIAELLRLINQETLSRAVEPAAVARLGGQAVVVHFSG